MCSHVLRKFLIKFTPGALACSSAMNFEPQKDRVAIEDHYTACHPSDRTPLFLQPTIALRYKCAKAFYTKHASTSTSALSVQVDGS